MMAKTKCIMAEITLGGTPTNTSGDLPAVGTSLANYEFVKHDMSPLSLDSLKGQKVVLNIFPSVDTGVCATSVRTFNQKASELDGTTVVCVSKDLPFALARFCGAEGIENVQVTTDFRNGDFAKENGLLITDGAFSGLDARAIIVLDETGKVAYTELVPEIGQEPNYDAALAAL